MTTIESDGSAQGRARATELIRAAGVLLEAGAFPEAVQALHDEAGRQLGHTTTYTGADTSAAAPAARAGSALEHARERQAQLAQELGVVGARGRKGRWWAVLEEAPTWVAWGVVIVLAVGFGRKSFSEVSRESKWKEQFSEGAWIARYYANTKFNGAPVTRVEAAANHEFRSSSPAPGIPKDRWSARWDTCLVVKERVELDVRLSSDDGSRLLLDEAPQIVVGPRPGKESGKLTLEPGVRLLTLELIDKGRQAYLRVDGFELEGNERYSLVRPQLDDDDVRCE